jgi:hypothetical protein
MENIVSDANENFLDIEIAEEHSKSLNHDFAERIQGAGEDGMSLRFDCSDFLCEFSVSMLSKVLLHI